MAIAIALLASSSPVLVVVVLAPSAQVYVGSTNVDRDSPFWEVRIPPVPIASASLHLGRVLLQETGAIQTRRCLEMVSRSLLVEGRCVRPLEIDPEIEIRWESSALL